MPIHADVYTTDGEPLDIVFDAEPWFQSAADDEIANLQDDQGEGEIAREIARWMADKDPKVAEFVDRCDQHGYKFECYIDSYEVEDWVVENRPELAKYLGYTEDEYDWGDEELKQEETPAQIFTPSSSVLVIHPTDSSTAFLDLVYTGKGYDVLNNYKGDLNALLPHYERIIMMGHGWVEGLFSMGQFRGHFAIDDKSVSGLRGKNNTYIWCKANVFTSQYGLKGYACGMFISEVREAKWFNVPATQEIVDHSNMLFTNLIAKIDQPTLEQVLKEYNGDDPVIQYNRAQMITVNK